MAPRTRVVSGSSTHSAGSASRPPETAMEVAYNTAVQSFVRRDHGKTQAALAKLLGQLDNLPRRQDAWYDLVTSSNSEEDEAEEWRVKVLKLVISAHASVFSDPPTNPETIPASLRDFLPPASPESILNHVETICQTTLQTKSSGLSSNGAAPLLPPPLLSTLILASLKLKPSAPALDFAHRITESWLADLPDAFMRQITTTPASAEAEVRKRNEGAREAYLKVVELFVGEVLAREGEYEMARAFLDGETVLGSKRKENLYRHLRSVEHRSKSSAASSSSSASASPASSGLLPPQSPSASLVLPSQTSSSRQSRSRSSSTSSSSSERTARPRSAIVNANGHGSAAGLASFSQSRNLAQPSNRSVNGKGKGKGKAMDTGDVDVEAGSVDTASTLPVPKKIYVNSSGSGSGSASSSGPSRRPHHTTIPRSRVQRNLTSILDLIPPAIKQRLTSPSFVLSLILPIPLAVLLVALWWRRRRAGRGTVGNVVAGVAGVEVVRQRLADVRRRGGVRTWLAWAIRWWLAKVVGIAKMATAISYL